MFKFCFRIFAFYFITTFGSALSSVATFLSIEKHFYTVNSLAISLALRTLAAAFISYNASWIINKIGVKKSFLLSQLFGCCALFPLFCGFYLNNFLLTVCGVMLTGLAPNFLAIVLTVVLRFFSQSAEGFRKYSGQKELVFWSGTFLAFILVPFILIRCNYNFILIFDAVTYVVGLFILFSVQFIESGSKISFENNTPHTPIVKSHFTSNSTRIFLLQTFASLILAGLTPILSSSSHIELTEHFSILLRQSMWSIEALTGVLASTVYIVVRKIPWKNRYNLLLMANGLMLFIPLVIGWKYIIVFTTTLVSILIAISFMRFRDDYVLSAKNDSELIKAYSSIAVLQRSFVYFLSPLLLGYVFSKFKIADAVLCIFLIQLALIGIYLLISASRKNLKIDSLVAS